MRAPQWSWQGAVALVLAIGIFIAESLLCIGEAVKLVRGFELSAAGINLITATLSALVGATATFLGRVTLGGGGSSDASLPAAEHPITPTAGETPRPASTPEEKP